LSREISIVWQKLELYSSGMQPSEAITLMVSTDNFSEARHDDDFVGDEDGAFAGVSTAVRS
jgi:hypothetical protein